MLKNIHYKILIWIYYQMGDILCNFEWNWCATLYQKFMLRSYDYDEKIGFWLWKEPGLNKETNL